MTFDELRELKELWEDESSSDDQLLEAALEHGGYVELVAKLLDAVEGLCGEAFA